MKKAQLKMLAFRAFNIKNHPERLEKCNEFLDIFQDSDNIKPEQVKYALPMHLREYEEYNESAYVDIMVDYMIKYFSKVSVSDESMDYLNDIPVSSMQEIELNDIDLEAIRQERKKDMYKKFKMLRFFFLGLGIVMLAFYWGYVVHFETFKLFGVYELSQLECRLLFIFNEIMIIFSSLSYYFMYKIDGMPKDDAFNYVDSLEESDIKNKLHKAFVTRLVVDVILKITMIILCFFGFIAKIANSHLKGSMDGNTLQIICSLPKILLVAYLLYFVYRIFSGIRIRSLKKRL